jgi:hypothetical protein
MKPNQEANARLIAAAPDLLAACQAAVAEGKDLDFGGNISIPPRVWVKIRAAIEKATGGTASA